MFSLPLLEAVFQDGLHAVDRFLYLSELFEF